MRTRKKSRRRARMAQTGCCYREADNAIKAENAARATQLRSPAGVPCREPFWDDHLADAVTHLREQDDGNLTRTQMRTEVYSLRHVNVKLTGPNPVIPVIEPLFVTWIVEGDFWALHETMRLSPADLFGQPLKKWLADLGRHLGCSIFMKSKNEVSEKILDVEIVAQVARRKLPPTDPVLTVLFDACDLHKMAPKYPFVSLDDFRHYVFDRAFSKHPRAQHEQRRSIDAAITTATAGDLKKTAENIKSAWLVAGPSLSEQMGEAVRGMLKPSVMDQIKGIGDSFKSKPSMLSSSQILKDSFPRFENMARLKIAIPVDMLARVNPMEQFARLSPMTQIGSPQMNLKTAIDLVQLKVPKFQTAADLFSQVVPVNPVVEAKRQLDEMMFGPMARIRAAIKASRPKRPRKPRAKKPPTETPSAD